MSNSLFIDCGNLNVLFRIKDKFCLASSYKNNPSQLLADANSLGKGFDIYLSLLPRKKTEGDLLIDELSVGGVPFYILKEEFESIIKFVERFEFVNNIYICNALCNFLVPAKVKNFNAVIPYGNRFAFIDVKNSMVESFEIYDNQLDFVSAKTDDFNCYGDVDIIDIDTLKYQYPELIDVNKITLTCLTHLIVSYHSSYKVNYEDISYYFNNEQKDTNNIDVLNEILEQPIENIEDDTQHNDIIDNSKLIDENSIPHNKSVEVIKSNLLSNKLLQRIIIALCLFILGMCFGLKDIDKEVGIYKMQVSQLNDLSSYYEGLSSIYRDGHLIADDLIDFVKCVRESELPVKLESITATSKEMNITFSIHDENDKDSFISFLKEKYNVIGDVFDLGNTYDINNEELKNYSVIINGGD